MFSIFVNLVQLLFYSIFQNISNSWLVVVILGFILGKCILENYIGREASPPAPKSRRLHPSRTSLHIKSFSKMSTDAVTLDDVLRHLPPNESQRYLFERLDFDGLLAARCVNTLWQRLVDPMVEFHLNLSDSSKKYVAAFGSARKVSSMTVCMFKGKYPIGGLPLDLEMLRVTLNIMDESRVDRLVSDERRNIGLSEYNFRRLMKDFRFVSKLHLASLAVRTFTNPAILARVHLPNVEEIIVTFFDSGFHQLMPFMRNYFPRLNMLNVANAAEVRMDRPCLYTRIFGFVARHQKTLEEVTLIFPEGMIDDSVLQLNVHRQLRKDHKMPQSLYENVKTKLESLSLKRLTWDVSMLEGIARYNLGLSLLKNQTQLTELLIDNMHSKDRGLWEMVGKILEKCSETLTSVTLGGCMCGTPDLSPRNLFSCSWLKNCKQLANLEMVICGMFVDAIEDLPKKSIRCLNLGHMLLQDQIEYIALHMTNLETWVLPQRGCKVSILVPKINLYLFQVVLHLPNLSRVAILSECADEEKILEFVEAQPGIHRCGHVCTAISRSGNMGFHICDKSFQRDHSLLASFMAKYQIQILQNPDLTEHEVMELYLRNFFLRNQNVRVVEV